MQLGMPTLIEIKSLESCITLCRELGLSFIELNMNLPEYQVAKLDSDFEQFSKIAKNNNIYYTIHLDENLNPCDFNDRVAAAYTKTVLETIEVSKLLSVPILNMHMNTGIWFTMPDRKVFLFDEYEQEYLHKLISFRKACEDAIGDSNIKICVENCGDFKDKTFLQKGLVLLLESPVFALTFDVGHNAGANYTDEPIIMNNIEKLQHMHLHDALGQNNHLVLGSGDVEIDKYIKLATKYDCRIVLEVKTIAGLKQSVKWLKDKKYL